MMSLSASEWRELSQHIILEHSRNPRCQGPLNAPCLHESGVNPNCGDEIELWLDQDAAGNIQRLAFLGQGCAISQASASLMTSKLQGASREEVLRLRQDFQALLAGEMLDEMAQERLGDLLLLRGVREFPQRLPCALLGWQLLEKIMG
jgi:nitrogen fixation protein NifU and related proteins